MLSLSYCAMTLIKASERYVELRDTFTQHVCQQDELFALLIFEDLFSLDLWQKFKLIFIRRESFIMYLYKEPLNVLLLRV